MINKLPKKFQGLVKEVDFLGKGKGYEVTLTDGYTVRKDNKVVTTFVEKNMDELKFRLGKVSK